MAVSTVSWEKTFNLYNTIKLLYALCEETDPDLCTNLQPLNEFRAALDHLMRVIAIENLEEYNDKDPDEELRKLGSHLHRAFFDICDMLSINLRGRITKALQDYDVEEIQYALPEYYSEIKPRIEEISETIADLRTGKRFNKSNEEDVIDEYPLIIQELQSIYKKVVSALPSLIDIRAKNRGKKREQIIVQWVIPIVSILVGVIIAIIF